MRRVLFLALTAAALPACTDEPLRPRLDAPMRASLPAPFLEVGSMIDLGTLGGTRTQANAINNHGQVVGESYDAGWNMRAFLVTVTPARERYAFTGFLRPVENLPLVNVARAGSAIPIRFGLGGDRGLDVMAAGYPSSVAIACDSGAGAASIEEEALPAGRSELSYDAVADQYVYAWKTDRSWAGSCRQLVVRLADGSEHRASFRFTR